MSLGDYSAAVFALAVDSAAVYDSGVPVRMKVLDMLEVDRTGGSDDAMTDEEWGASTTSQEAARAMMALVDR